LARALIAPLSPIDWSEADDLAAQPAMPGSTDGEAAIRH